MLSLSYGRIIERDVESNDGLLPESRANGNRGIFWDFCDLFRAREDQFALKNLARSRVFGLLGYEWLIFRDEVEWVNGKPAYDLDYQLHYAVDGEVEVTEDRWVADYRE